MGRWMQRCQRYLTEAAQRFNRRFRLRQLLTRLACAKTLCKLLSERVLHPATNFMAKEHR